MIRRFKLTKTKVSNRRNRSNSCKGQAWPTRLFLSRHPIWTCRPTMRNYSNRCYPHSTARSSRKPRRLETLGVCCLFPSKTRTRLCTSNRKTSNQWLWLLRTYIKWSPTRIVKFSNNSSTFGIKSKVKIQRPRTGRSPRSRHTRRASSAFVNYKVSKNTSKQSNYSMNESIK